MTSRSIVILACFLCTSTWAAYPDAWIAIAGRYTLLYEETANSAYTVSGKLSSVDVAADTYIFWGDGSLGLFIHNSFIFPVSGSITMDGNTTSVDLGKYDSLFGLGTIIGPGWRIRIASKLSALIGFGLNAQFFTGYYQRSIRQETGPVENESYSFWTMNLGIGGNISLKFDLTKSLYLSLGAAIAYDRAIYGEATLNGVRGSGWGSDYSSVMVSPHMGIGTYF